MLELLPILKTLLRNKLASILIVTQLAFTVAIVSNSLFVIKERHDLIHKPTGLADQELVYLTVKTLTPSIDLEQIVKRDLEMIRSMDGVIDATAIGQIPLSQSGSVSKFQLEPGKNMREYSANRYYVDERGLNTLGLVLEAGRNFASDEVYFFENHSTQAENTGIITKQLADEMFPKGDALGKTIFMQGGATSITIVGIVEHMLGAWPQWEKKGNVILFPGGIKSDFIRYMIRSKEEDRHRVLESVTDKLRDTDHTRTVGQPGTMEETLLKTYANDYAMIKILIAVITMLVFVNALGIVGLTTFWVNQRRKQIGIRRALGATRTAISRYFIVETIVLTLLACGIGGTLAFFASDYMARNYSKNLLDWPFTVVTGGFLIILTSMAAAFPAWKASLIPPAEATASV